MDIFSLAVNILNIILSPFIKMIKWFYSKLPFAITSKKPAQKLGIIESSWQDHRWSYGKRGNEDVIFINTFWQITNTLSYNLTAINAYMLKPANTKGHVIIKDVDSDYWGRRPIPKGYTTEIDVSFIIDKTYVKDGKSILKTVIEIQDPLGRRHKIKDILVAPVSTVPIKKDNLFIENSSLLKNKAEKQVVAVLKNEVQQYRVRGRREGRLGTVEWPRGTIEWRGSDSKIKFLFETSSKDNVKSEHIDALVSLYNKSSQQDKRLIEEALVKRIDKNSEYREIGYLIIFFLFEIGKLEGGLKAASARLKGDKAHGFSDSLRLLDFLLAFRYTEFEEEELDSIERFVYSTKEDPFNIKERINAIRVKKMIEESK